VTTRHAACSCGQLSLVAEAVPLGAFADPSFPPPTVSVYGSRRHPWVVLPDSVEDVND
jgi:hypothetical protein